MDEKMTVADRTDARTWWWLSFADDSRPAGQRFLGACLVQAVDIVDACKQAHRHGINPGGQVLGHAVAARKVIPDGWTERLLSRQECEELDRIMQKAH